MKNLATVNSNTLYRKNKKGEMDKVINIILILDEADYRYSAEGKVFRDRKLERVDFMVLEGQLDALIDILKEIKEDKKSE